MQQMEEFSHQELVAWARISLVTLVAAWSAMTLLPSHASAAARPPGLADVDCVSATSCVGVGSFVDENKAERVLIMQWDGEEWQVQTKVQEPEGATSAHFNSVSCLQGQCFAAGEATIGSGAEAETTAFVDVDMDPFGTGNWLESVYPGLAANLTLGAKWSSLAGIHCDSEVVCVAVGSYSTSASGSNPQPLIERLIEEEWQVDL